MDPLPCRRPPDWLCRAVKHGIQERFHCLRERCEVCPTQLVLLDHACVRRHPRGRRRRKRSWKRVGLTRRERLLERAPKLSTFDLSNTGEERHVGEILYAGVRALARER